MSCTLQNLTPRTGTPSSPFPESVFQRGEQSCEDQRPQQSGALTELPHLTRLAGDRDYRHFTGDGQFTEHEYLRVRPLSFHQSIIASTHDSTESIATSLESDSDDEQLSALLASPLYPQELQQETYAQRLELDDAHQGYVESRREQVRQKEELGMKEKALRDTQIRSIHEMGEMNRAQELRVDKFSVQKIERKS